jgi:hypothetical protein
MNLVEELFAIMFFKDLSIPFWGTCPVIFSNKEDLLAFTFYTFWLTQNFIRYSQITFFFSKDGGPFEFWTLRDHDFYL